MIKYFYRSIYILLAAVLFACNKNSNEILPIAPDESLREIELKSNGTTIGQISLVRTVSTSQDSTSLVFTNESGKTLESITYYLQFCTNQESFFDSCTTVWVDSLNNELENVSSDTSKNILNLPDNYTDLYINGGILSLNEKKTIEFANIYLNSSCVFKSDSAPIINAQVKSIIEADGTSVFHFKTGMGEEYKLTGLFSKFSNQNFFSGKLIDKNQYMSDVTLDSASSDSISDQVTFILSNPLNDSLNKIELTLK